MIQISMISQKIVENFSLKDKAQNGYIVARVTNGVYKLPQSGLTAHDSLVQHLENYEYRSSSNTLGLWIHDSPPIIFTLVVDYFWVKYLGKEHALHLKAALEDK